MKSAIILAAALLALSPGPTQAESTWPVECVGAPGWDEVKCYLAPVHCLWNSQPAVWQEQCAKL